MNHFLPRRLLAVVFTALLGVVAFELDRRVGVGRHVRARARARLELHHDDRR